MGCSPLNGRSRWFACISSALLGLLLSVKVISDKISVVVDASSDASSLISRFRIARSEIPGETASKFQIYEYQKGSSDAGTAISCRKALELLVSRF
jgi:hypothetical protein